MEKDSHQSAVKDSRSDISMFDASEVVAAQMRNIVMLGGEFEFQGVPLVELLKSRCEHIVALSCEKLSHWLKDSTEELKPQLVQSGCKTLADFVLKTLRVSTLLSLYSSIPVSLCTVCLCPAVPLYCIFLYV